MDVAKEIEYHWSINGDKINFKKGADRTYDMIRGNLTRYAYSRLRDWFDAEDAVQEAYVHALTYPPHGDHHNFGGLMKLWLDQSIVLVRLRKQNRLRSEEEDTIEEEESYIDKAESPDVPPERLIDIVGQTDVIMDMSEALKPKQKNIVRLSMIFGYSHKEIQKILKVDAKQIDNTLYAFRLKIKDNDKYEDLR